MNKWMLWGFSHIFMETPIFLGGSPIFLAGHWDVKIHQNTAFDLKQNHLRLQQGCVFCFIFCIGLLMGFVILFDKRIKYKRQQNLSNPSKCKASKYLF